MLPEIRTILYASDLGEGSRPAFRMAIKQAMEHRARIIFLHVIEPFAELTEEILEEYLPKAVSTKHSAQILETQKQRIEQRIQHFLETEALDTDMLIEPPTALVLVGQPDKLILKTAQKKNADLIVMGDRENSTLSRLFLGSTAQKVVHRSSAPVLIVPLQKNR